MRNAAEMVFSFSSTNHAIQAEQCLLDAALAVRVMPLPSAIKAGCGICLRLPWGERAAALSCLRARDISPQHVHVRTIKRGASSYLEWTGGLENED